MRPDYARLLKAARAYKRAVRSADSLYEDKVTPALKELRAAALAVGDADTDAPESTEPSDQR